MAGKKTKEVEVSSDQSQNNRLQNALFQDLVKKIQKKHGDSILVNAATNRANDFKKIPTNIFQLDHALGGGFPTGMVNILYGLESTMKTSLILRTIGNAQKLCSTCWNPKTDHPIIGNDKVKICDNFCQTTTAFIDVEGSFNRSWAQDLGVDLEHVILSQPSYAEQAIDIADSLLRSGNIDILVVDSLAFLVPTKEIEKSAEDHIMGTQAQLIGKLVRKTVSALNDMGNINGKRPTVFWTNQIRQTMTMFGDPNVMTGGKASPYAAATILKLATGKAEFESEKEKEEAPLFIPITFKVMKNKSGIPKMEGEFKLALSTMPNKRRGDVYDEDKLAEYAQKVGIYKKDGGHWYLEGVEIGRAEKNLEEKLLIDPELKERVKKLVTEKLKNVAIETPIIDSDMNEDEINE